LGSGNRYRFDKKTTTEECHAVDIRYLRRNGLLTSDRGFSLSWSRAGRETGSIRAVIYRDRIVLSYSHHGGQGGEWEKVEEPLPLEWTSCNFGGERPWFLCPGAGCSRRVAIIYGPGKYFLCRHCYDLRYESQREDKNDRALRRARKIRKRLGGSANMLETFPERSKGMHHDTYERLRQGCHEAEKEHLVGMRELLYKLQEQIA
jgi:hypothetical protein